MIEPLPKPRPPTTHPSDALPAAYIYSDVLEEIRFNGGFKPNAMAGGLCVGGHYRCPQTERPFVEIEGFLAGTHVDTLADFLRYLRIQWKAAATTLRYSFPSSEVVGWYAAFPTVGAQWGQDAIVLHNTFFSHPWQIGLWVPGEPDGTTALGISAGVATPHPVGVISRGPSAR